MLVSLRTMRFPQWKKIDWIFEELTWNLSRNLTKNKTRLTLSRLLLVPLMCFCIKVSKFIVISKRSPTILEIHNSKLVNSIFLFKGKLRSPSYFFGFIVILLAKHKHYLNSWIYHKVGYLDKENLSVVTSIVWNLDLKISWWFQSSVDVQFSGYI